MFLLNPYYIHTGTVMPNINMIKQGTALNSYNATRGEIHLRTAKWTGVIQFFKCMYVYVLLLY